MTDNHPDDWSTEQIATWSEHQPFGVADGVYCADCGGRIAEGETARAYIFNNANQSQALAGIASDALDSAPDGEAPGAFGEIMDEDEFRAMLPDDFEDVASGEKQPEPSWSFYAVYHADQPPGKDACAIDIGGRISPEDDVLVEGEVVYDENIRERRASPEETRRRISNQLNIDPAHIYVYGDDTGDPRYRLQNATVIQRARMNEDAEPSNEELAE